MPFFLPTEPIQSASQSGDSTAGRARGEDGVLDGSFGEISLSSNRDKGSAPSNASGGIISESTPETETGHP